LIVDTSGNGAVVTPVPQLPATTSVVVMGVSGSGKTTIARELVHRLGWEYAEGDDFHPAANVEKMRTGTPLDDDDRWPWLRSLAAWIGERAASGTSVVVTCSALKRSYRDLLRQNNPSVWFAHVTVGADVIQSRLSERRGHYMPASLLTSQLAALEPLQQDEPGLAIPGDGSPADVVNRVLRRLHDARDVRPRGPDGAP
jgi:gluconokinase